MGQKKLAVGRPKKAVKKDKQIIIPVTKEEKAIIRQHAENKGKEMAPFLRDLGLKS